MGQNTKDGITKWSLCFILETWRTVLTAVMNSIKYPTKILKIFFFYNITKILPVSILKNEPEKKEETKVAKPPKTPRNI